jgi:metallo-beta-lactamase family protein
LRLEKVRPLYTRLEAEEALSSFDGYPYRHPVSIGKTATCTLYDAGHILGSAISIIRLEENGRTHTVCYSGDIGRFDKPIIKDPTLVFSEQDQEVDLMIIESTYGNRIHEPVRDLKPQLKKVLIETYNRGGSILIPSFAFGRTQELLYVLHELYNESEVPRPAVYVDSPLATNLTRVFGEHPELYDQDTHTSFLEKHLNPFSSDQIRFVGSVEESMALNREEKPHIVIAASGMCESGRILHHLRHKMHNPKNTILIVGFMAQHTLGRKILVNGERYENDNRKGTPPVLKLLNKEYPLKARVLNLGGFSAHGDKNEMLRFLKESNLKIKKFAVVHGEEDQALSFAKNLNNSGFQARVPKMGESISI